MKLPDWLNRAIRLFSIRRTDGGVVVSVDLEEVLREVTEQKREHRDSATRERVQVDPRDDDNED